MKSNKSKRAKAKEQKSKRAKAKEQILNPATKTTNKAKGIQKTWLSKPAKQTKRRIQADPKQKLAIQKRKSSKPPNQAKPSKQTNKARPSPYLFPVFQKTESFPSNSNRCNFTLAYRDPEPPANNNV